MAEIKMKDRDGNKAENGLQRSGVAWRKLEIHFFFLDGKIALTGKISQNKNIKICVKYILCVTEVQMIFVRIKIIKF